MLHGDLFDLPCGLFALYIARGSSLFAPPVQGSSKGIEQDRCIVLISVAYIYLKLKSSQHRPAGTQGEIGEIVTTVEVSPPR